jgi:hypothetical protein
VEQFCLDNPKRFGGLVYCMDCQRRVKATAAADSVTRSNEDLETERAFEAALLEAYESWKQIGYVATRFRLLISNRGGVETARILLAKSGTPSGFERLANAGRLEQTMEYVVLRPEFGALFSAEERSIARRRLVEHGMRRDALPTEPYA